MQLTQKIRVCGENRLYFMECPAPTSRISTKEMTSDIREESKKGIEWSICHLGLGGIDVGEIRSIGEKWTWKTFFLTLSKK